MFELIDHLYLIQCKWLQMSLYILYTFEFSIYFEKVSVHATLGCCIPHVNLLTCCLGSNYPGTAAALLVNLVIFLLLPLSRFSLSFRYAAAHKIRKWSLGFLGSFWRNVALKLQTWNPPLYSCAMLRLSFETFRLSQGLQGLEEPWSRCFRLLRNAGDSHWGLFGFGFGEGHGPWVRMWLSLRVKRKTAPLIPLMRKIASFVIDFASMKRHGLSAA